VPGPRNGGLLLGVFELIGHKAHESVHFGVDPASGLNTIVAIHSTVLGPSLGGTRFFPYPDEHAALADVLRLAEGMTYKAAAAGLDQGGGKAVIVGDPEKIASDDLFRAYGRFINGLSGRYITAEDVGTSVADMATVATQTSYVSGLPLEDGGSGDPSPATARGVVASIRAVSGHLWGTDDLDGRTIAIKGVGKVGSTLGGMLAARGAVVVISDVNDSAANAAADRFGAEVVPVQDIHRVDCDIYSPCALGGDLSKTSISELKCAAVVGSANNQLAQGDGDAERLASRGILYAPDFVVSAGGIINIAAESGGYSMERANSMIDNISNTLTEILGAAERLGVTTEVAAKRFAERRIQAASDRGNPS